MFVSRRPSDFFILFASISDLFLLLFFLHQRAFFSVDHFVYLLYVLVWIFVLCFVCLLFLLRMPASSLSLSVFVVAFLRANACMLIS